MEPGGASSLMMPPVQKRVKASAHVFHSMEKYFAFFPRYGKNWQCPKVCDLRE